VTTSANKSKEDNLVDQLMESVRKWAVPGTSLQRDEWNGESGGWTVGLYGDDMFDKCHNFLAAAPNAQYIVLSTGDYKRDLGLYAMEYPDTYVATAIVTTDGDQIEEEMGERFYELLGEAQDFDGPSVLVVFLHELPFLFRYNPRKEEQAFTPESGKMSSLVQAFLEREQQTVLFLKKSVAQDDAAGDLVAGLASAGNEPITVMYGSDTGHADECARKISRIIKQSGRAIKSMPMNSCQEIPEGVVLFVTATAGKGEFPANALTFGEKLLERTEPIEGLKFSTFSLGDSKYWPEPEHFAAAGRKLHAKLLELGATPIVDLGIGDDQDQDQYRTGYGKWEAAVKSALNLKVSAEAEKDGGDAPHKTPEDAKYESNFLRGTLGTSLKDRTTGGIPQPDQIVIKHHGIYQQDDRDMRSERTALGLEPAWSFMARVRLTAGDATAAQWIAMDKITRTLSRPNLKITTRQTWQIQGVAKHNLIESIRCMQRAALDTIAACGDVARNVCTTSNPMACSPVLMEEVIRYSKDVHDHCLPKTSAWHEIFILDGPAPQKKYKVGGSTPYEEEPIYGKHYLPRKFKMGVAIPPYNDVDIYTHDLGFIAIIQGNELKGFNVLVGGGLGFTHNNRKTFPRLGTMMGFIHKDKAKYVAEAVMVVQRDYGDRSDRKHARLKYTVHDHGNDWFVQQVEDLLGYAFEPARPFEFKQRTDELGWMSNEAGWHMGLYIEGGRVQGKERDGLLKIAEMNACRFRLTCNESLLLTHIRESDKAAIEAIVNESGIRWHMDEKLGGLRKGAFACAALPMCVMAFAEAERYLPALVSLLELELAKCGLYEDEIVIRMTGCPNSCGRPEMAEIGLIGVAPGMYKLYLGGDHLGTRANRIFKEGVDEAQILEALTPLFADYAAHRQKGERFGNFLVRTGVVKENKYGPDFHDF
jgi:sulfite reductase (NADPH) hemoprotein beta-component